MNFSAIFIRRPVATTLLTLAVALGGVVAYQLLPIASLPQVDFPAISVQASLPGVSPETMAATVATPLERSLGQIAGVTEMTSTSTQGSTRVSLQFDLDRDINGAARDVQSAINAARSLLPSNLPANPTYRKANAASMPMIAIALTSDTHTQEQLYDVAFTLLGQKIAQVKGVGQINVNGSALPAVRVEVNPTALNRLGVGFEQVRQTLAQANAHQPKGVLEDDGRQWQIDANDQAKKADEYRELIVAWRNGAPVRLGDVAEVKDSVQDLRNAGSSGGKPAVSLAVVNQPGANTVEAVDTIKAMLPGLQASIPAGIDLQVVMDRTTTIRASLREVEHTLLVSIALVILVVFLFLRNVRATLIPSVAIPVSLLGTLIVMRLCGYSLNNLSLMALIIATGFVVDDAIVVVENVSQHIERGLTPLQAALRGAQEVGFTVFSMSLSLVAVFVPILLMGGIVGRLFREFSLTLAVAVAVSLVVSLTTTPMMCAHLLRHESAETQGWFNRGLESGMAALQRVYGRSLAWALRHGVLMVLLLLATVGLNVHLFSTIPKGFFPQQDTGRLQGFFQADQSISFQAMRQKINQLMKIVGEEPELATFYEYTGGFGGGQNNTGSFFALLKTRPERTTSAADIVARIKPKLAKVPGATLFLTPQQDIQIGARPGSAQFQYSLLANDLDQLRSLTPKLRDALAKLPELADVNADFQDKGLQTTLVVDRATASKLGISSSMIDSTLNNAFGQRLVSTLYEPLNQYYVVLNVAPEFALSPQALDNIYLSTNENTKIPLAAISHYESTNAPLAVNHQGQFAAATISFNLAPGVSLSQATTAIEAAFAKLDAGTQVRGRFAGTAQAFKDSLDSQPWLILAALLTVYIVLGILYESYIHPLTILSTLPSAGVGALLALRLCDTEFTIIALIGVILLIGIVKKNAIMMIDCAVEIERREHKRPEESIYQACLLRFRPILMTTLAAMFGALPLAIAGADGSELRRPLGISIVGGLLSSQILTLYTTPVVYLYLDRLRWWCKGKWERVYPSLNAEER
jgi:multidrug efflux pump